MLTGVDLDNLSLRVRVAPACRKFYVRHFRFRLAFEAEGGYFIRNEAGFLLAVVPTSSHQRLPDGFHIGFRAGGLDDVTSMRADLVGAGVPIGPIEDYRARRGLRHVPMLGS